MTKHRVVDLVAAECSPGREERHYTMAEVGVEVCCKMTDRVLADHMASRTE